MRTFYHFLYLLVPAVLSTGQLLAQRVANPALDSMGANLGRQNWKAATYWAVKAAEANPAEKYWRYLNAADFASRDKNAELAIRYAALVVDSDIVLKAAFGNSFDWLRDDPRWKTLMAKAATARENHRQARRIDNLAFRRYQQDLLSGANRAVDSLADIGSAEELYRRIRDFRPVHNYSRSGRYQYAWLPFADSIDVPYLIQLPAGFNAGKRYPLVVVLHGAVTRQVTFADPDSTSYFFGRSFMELADQSGMIAVFPSSTRAYNWMMPDDGFDLVPQIVRQVKQQYRIDDSRVYVTGHSNGATGAFSYLMKQPGLFAGFSGVNNRPQVRTGGTFLKNGLNRSFYNVATDYDYYFPLEGHRLVTQLAQKLGIDWRNEEIDGQRTHGYLITSRDTLAGDVYRRLFRDMLTKRRDPFQARLYWECDQVEHGRCDWIAIDRLDTLSAKADWHEPVNATVQGWRHVMNPAVLLDSTSRAFVFPRRSGAVQASYADNEFRLKTSRVGAVTIYLSPEMVDFKRPVKVIVNDRVLFNQPVTMDRAFLLAQYRLERDQQALWANHLRLTIP